MVVLVAGLPPDCTITDVPDQSLPAGGSSGPPFALLLRLDGELQAPTHPQFAWKALDGATFCRLQVATASDFSEIVWDDSSLTVPSTFLLQVTRTNVTSFFWRVLAIGRRAIPPRPFPPRDSPRGPDPGLTWAEARAYTRVVGDEAADLSGFSGIVPMFPLPNVVLFPRMLLPLHIFEPRYRAMTRTALDGERYIAMALLQPGWQKHYEGSPAVHRILGLGKIVEDTALDDGRFNLVLFGMARLKLLEEPSREPYRTARVEILQEKPASGPGYDRKRRLLLAFYVQVLKQISQGALAAPPEDAPLGLLCDLLASLIAFDPGVKQSLLEELDVAARCDLLLELLHRMNAPGFGGSEEGRKKPWPPGPSLN